MADQQLKQMLLAYMMLVVKGRPLLHEDLDNTCEDFLYKEFDHPIDYDLDAALPRLKRWGLLRENTQVWCCDSGSAIPVLLCQAACLFCLLGQVQVDCLHQVCTASAGVSCCSCKFGCAHIPFFAAGVAGQA
jgi:hypothetical protein